MKNKILIITIIFVLISFLFINNSFAVANYPDVAETVESFGHLYRKYIVISCNNNGEEMILLWVFGCSSESLIENSRFEITETGVDIVVSSLDLTANGGSLQYQSYNILDGKWNAHGYSYLNNGQTKTLGTGATDGVNLKIYESSHPVYYKGTDTIFSTEPPMILSGIVKEMEMMEPIVTTLLGLLGLLIPLLICLIGFWKVWSLLSRILHKS